MAEESKAIVEHIQVTTGINSLLVWVVVNQ